MEEIWTLDYEAEGAAASKKLAEAMRNFLPKLKAMAKIQRVDTLLMRAPEQPQVLRLRVNIIGTGNPFAPPWPDEFLDTQIGQPKIFRPQAELSFARK